MTGRIVTYTVIRVGLPGIEAVPYAVVIANIDGRMIAGRVCGDPSWLGVGVTVEALGVDDGPPTFVEAEAGK